MKEKEIARDSPSALVGQGPVMYDIYKGGKKQQTKDQKKTKNPSRRRGTQTTPSRLGAGGGHR